MKAFRKKCAAFAPLSLMALLLSFSFAPLLVNAAPVIALSPLVAECTKLEVTGTLTGDFVPPLIIQYTKRSSGERRTTQAIVDAKDKLTATIEGLSPDNSPYDFTITHEGTPRTLYTGTFTSAASTKGCDTAGGTGSSDGTLVVAEPHDTYADIFITVKGDTPVGVTVSVKYGSLKTNLPSTATAMWNGTKYYAGISPLLSNTQYYYRVYASDGTELTNGVQSFFTTVPLGTKTNGIVTALSVTDIRQTQITVSGKVATTATRIDILIDRSGNGTFDWKTSPTIKADKTFSFPITGLKPGRAYHLVAVKSGDPSVRYTNVQAFGTPPVYVSAYMSEIKDTKATVAAEVSEGIENLTVYYGKDSLSMTTRVAMYLDPINLNRYIANLDDLSPDTGYYYVIGTGDGKTMYMNPGTFITLAKASPTGAVVSTISGQGSGGAPKLSWSGAGLVTCGQDGPLTDNKQQACGFPEFMQMISNIIDFILFFLCPIIVTVLFLYHGIMILVSGGNSEKLGEAKSALMKVIIGFALACGAWIIVKFVLVSLGVDTTVFPVFY